MKSNRKRKYVSALATTAMVASAVAPTAFAIEHQKVTKPEIQDSYEHVEAVKVKEVETVKEAKALPALAVTSTEHTASVQVDQEVSKPVQAKSSNEQIVMHEVPSEDSYATVLNASELEDVVKMKPVEKPEVPKDKELAKDKGEEVKLDEVRPPTKEELDARRGLDSNNDEERRKALEDEFGIELTDDMVWEDKKGQTTVNPDGTVSEYTSHDEMKALGFYAVNANRQELIQYGIKTGDWQPYRAFEAKKTPGFFEIVNGKYEYTKAYYGHLLQSHLMNYNAKIAEMTQRNVDRNSDEWKDVEKSHKSYMEENVKAFNEAPGVTPYVPHLNHNEAVAKETGAVMYSKDFFDSKYNHPDFLRGLIK